MMAEKNIIIKNPQFSKLVETSSANPSSLPKTLLTATYDYLEEAFPQ